MKNQKIHVNLFIGRRPHGKEKPNDAEELLNEKNIAINKLVKYFETIEGG